MLYGHCPFGIFSGRRTRKTVETNEWDLILVFVGRTCFKLEFPGE